MADDPSLGPKSRPFFEMFENPMRSPPSQPTAEPDRNESTSTLGLIPPKGTGFVDRNWSLVKESLRAGTDVETELAPVYRYSFLLMCICPLGPIVSMIVLPDAPFFELMTQLYFAPMQAAVAIYLVSRLTRPEMPVTEKIAFSILVFSTFAQAIQRLQLGRERVSLTLFAYGLFYIAIYKMLRRLRKRLTQLSKTEIVKYLSWSVFRTGFASLVPIVYLSSESFGCIAAESPSDTTGMENMQSRSYAECGNIVSSNHAMAFHLSMLLTVKLFILPFEKDVSLNALKNFQLSAHHQVVVVMVLIASMSAIFVFATRREDSNTYSYWGGFNITYVLLSTLHMCWGIVFVSFGLDAIKFHRRGGNFQRTMPWWNKFLATNNDFALGPVYRWLMVATMTYLPIQSLAELIADGNGKGSWRYTSGSILFFHLSLAALYICSMPRKPGFPWSELVVYTLAPLSLLFKVIGEVMSDAKKQHNIRFVQIGFGIATLTIFWPIIMRARKLVGSLPDDRLKAHMEHVFSGSTAFLSPILFVSLEGLNCPLNHMNPMAVDQICPGIIVPCSNISFHILCGLVFTIFFRPHVKFDPSDILVVERIPWYRQCQLFSVFWASVISLYVYASRSEDIIENSIEELEIEVDLDDQKLRQEYVIMGETLYNRRYNLRNFAFATTVVLWVIIFVTQFFVFWKGWEGGRGKDVEGGQSVTEEENRTIEEGGKQPQERAPRDFRVTLSRYYIWPLRALVVTLTFLPLAHIFWRNRETSYYLVTLVEIPLMFTIGMLFAATPRQHTRRGLKLLSASFFSFNLIFVIGEIVAIFRFNDSQGGRWLKEKILNVLTSALQCVLVIMFYPVLTNTADRLKKFNDDEIEKYIKNAFMRAMAAFAPLLYLTFEASSTLYVYIWDDVRRNKMNAEMLVKTCHAISFHIVATFFLFLFVTPFIKLNPTLKQLYMFDLPYHIRLQGIGAFVGSCNSLLLFAVRWSWMWGSTNKTATVLIKLGWFFIAVLEWREIKKQKREGGGDEAVEEDDGRKFQAGEGEDGMMFEMLEM